MLEVPDRHSIGRLLRAKGVAAWGVAANRPRLPHAPDFPVAIAIAMRLDPRIVSGLRSGPSREYLLEYDRVNAALDDATGVLVEHLRAHGPAAEALPATDRGEENPGRFPHKTAATSAGLGWIGKTALFVSPQFGPAVRLATVFTNLALEADESITKGRCGRCRVCVDACPAGCGRDVRWHAGMPREQLLDAAACRRHLDASAATLGAAICGICVAACPYAVGAGAEGVTP